MSGDTSLVPNQGELSDINLNDDNNPGGKHNKDNDGAPITICQFRNHSKLDKFRYGFQYPYFRMFMAYFVTVCNFLIYAEDPVAHSYSKCDIPVVGNIFSMVFTKYPHNGFSALKVLCWLIALVIGLVIGKKLIHSLFLDRKLRLGMFSRDQGSWMICFLTTLIVILISSFIYNSFLSLDKSMERYKIDGYIGATNHTFMRAAALGTWFGDFITAWMVTDMMMQDTQRYAHWAKAVRKWWNIGTRRVVMFWVFSVLLTVTVISAVCTHFINWDKLNRDQVYTNELGRAILASFILVMDVCIVMQDWDFPLFNSQLDLKLPGLNVGQIKIEFPDWMKNYTIHITGKWFQYGVLFIVMILDLNMWKNQIFYSPLAYGQYSGEDGHIFSVNDKFSLSNYNNATIFSYDWRKININPATNNTFMAADSRMNSRYRGYSMAVKFLAFIPSVSVFVVFGVLIFVFGRLEGNTDTDTSGAKLIHNKKKEDESGKIIGEQTITNYGTVKSPSTC